MSINSKVNRSQVNNLSVGVRPEEIQRNLNGNDEIFFEGNSQNATSEKKRSLDTDKVTEDQ
jgi:hypothetical protein